MWTCKKCREELEDSFTTCWSCGTLRSGIEDPRFRPEQASMLDRGTRPPMDCLRCKSKLDYVGTKAFHEGARWGILGDVAELFVKRKSFDLYVCADCGQVEFFVSGLGEPD